MKSRTKSVLGRESVQTSQIPADFIRVYIWVNESSSDESANGMRGKNCNSNSNDLKDRAVQGLAKNLIPKGGRELLQNKISTKMCNLAY